jgi:hypothetical protein
VLLGAGTAAAALLAVAFAVARPFGAADAAHRAAAAGTPPGPPLAALPEPLLDTTVVTAAVDSAAADSAAADSAPPPPRPAALTLLAPAEARLYLDRREVGTGRWDGRGLSPGRYVARAELADAAGCPTAQAEEPVTLGAGVSRTVRFSLVPCGQLLLDVSIEGRRLTPDRSGRFVVQGVRATRSGTVPMSAPLLLPAGAYRVTVGGVPRCAEFGADSVSVVPGQRAVLRVALLC